MKIQSSISKSQEFTISPRKSQNKQYKDIYKIEEKSEAYEKSPEKTLIHINELNKSSDQFPNIVNLNNKNGPAINIR